MFKNSLDFIFSKKHSPRWFIFLIDLLICSFSIILAFLLRFNFKTDMLTEEIIFFNISFVIVVRSISFIAARVYAGIIRYTSTKDAARIIIVVFLGSLFFIFANLLNKLIFHDKNFIPYSIIVIDFFVTSLFMLGFRLITKSIFQSIISDKSHEKQVVIYGADEYGMAAKATLSGNNVQNYKIAAFIDDNENKATKTKIDGILIHDVSELSRLMEKNNISLLIFAKKNVSPTIKKDIIEICLQYNVKAQSVPDINDWINGELSFNQLRRIKIEDLLERPPIELNNKEIQKQICDKTIFITGAAGSIGSEIVRQVIKFHPRQVIIFDQAESPLYDLELELCEQANNVSLKIIIGSVTNKERLEHIFVKEKPDIVFHAAAYKHVPMMENHPVEAIYTNVFGTKNVADLSVKYNIDKFVMVSTDKAVNPTNVMGASKRIAEIYTQSLNNISDTRFITTRFGNVLGSNGSVIPRFRKQIEEGGPVTVTHPEITRYFMTISEACRLVLEAGTMGNGGEIFIFDMGKSVKIIDLAKKMIKLYGLTLGKDIKISFTGLRPGEKLYEELLNSKENTLPTHHPQIMIAKVRKTAFEPVKNDIEILQQLLKQGNTFEIVKQMKNIVPEFKSKNSIFEQLDK